MKIDRRIDHLASQVYQWREIARGYEPYMDRVVAFRAMSIFGRLKCAFLGDIPAPPPLTPPR